MDNKTKDVNERIKERFIICYDKLTKPMAISLRNSITEDKETCVLWTNKVYNDNEYKLTNHNLLVLLNEKMIKEHLANPKVKKVNFSDGVILKHEGNSMGIMVDTSLDYLKYKDRIKSSWKKYIIRLPLGVPALAYKLYSDRNKIKTILLFDAIEKLKTKTIEKFLRGEQLD